MFVKQYSQPDFQAVSCNSSSVSSTTTGHFVLNKDVGPKLLGSENNEGKHNNLKPNDTAGVASAIATASCGVYFSWTLILRLSEIRPIPWFLTEEVEVLVDPSTWTNLNNESGTKDREDYLSSLVFCKAMYGSCFCTPPVCQGHFRISNVPPHSTVSLDWLHEYPENTFAKNFPGCTFSMLYVNTPTHISM